MEKIEISHRTIIFTILFLVFLWFLYQVRQVVLLFYIAFVLMAALNPVVNKLDGLKFPRPVSIFLIYLLIAGLLSWLIASIAPVFISQTNLLIDNFPRLIDKLSFLNIDFNWGDYSSQLAMVPGNLLRILAATFSNILSIFSIGVVAFYLLLEREKLEDYLHILFKRDGEKRAKRIINKFEKKIGGWVRGEIFLMVLVGILSYLGLRFLDLDFALPLAVLAGFLELVPNIGPTVSMIPALIVGLASSPVMGLSVFILYFLIQQLENNFIVPKIMQKIVGLHPLVTLAVLMFGLKLAGALGMLLSVPVFLTLQIVVVEVYNHRNSS